VDAEGGVTGLTILQQHHALEATLVVMPFVPLAYWDNPARQRLSTLIKNSIEYKQIEAKLASETIEVNLGGSFQNCALTNLFFVHFTLILIGTVVD
jgi:hypothetical protein